MYQNKKLRISSTNSTPVPQGVHFATFTGFEEGMNQHGANFKFTFTLHNGSTVTRFTSQTLSPQSNAGKLLIGMGAPIDQDIDIDALIGKTYLITVGPAGNGVRVDNVSVPPTPQPQPQTVTVQPTPQPQMVQPQFNEFQNVNQ